MQEKQKILQHFLTSLSYFHASGKNSPLDLPRFLISMLREKIVHWTIFL
ncbi:hypothetical protein STRCR_1130 [Streptococcus criceti HS-6]|uniref:Uncharacterized protein n=1 Tax=Streptococcus criceti HS-6 TaxID=873449 RepID=G5JTN3_STRCG|nr:hypothetical protein STRCR_1130 [Streptococcus criceti HS-6]